MDTGWVSAPPRGEFEQHQALLLSVTELLSFSPRTVVDLVRELVDWIELIAIVRDESQRQEMIVTLVDWGIAAHEIQFVFMPVGTWTRDFAPFFVRWSDGTPRIIHAEHWLRDRPNDAVVPAALSSLMRIPRIPAPLAVVGGNLLSNGSGMGICTSAILGINRLIGKNYGPDQIRALLGEYYGLSCLVLLEPIAKHRTTHVDMFATFTSPQTVVVGQCDARQDAESAAILDRNAEVLKRISFKGGNLRVERIPMPPLVDGICRTYTNVIFANGKLLVPHFPTVDQGLEREAFSVYRGLLPNWQIEQIDCHDLIQGKGALRCLTTLIPDMGPLHRPGMERGAAERMSSGRGAVISAGR